jgi:hypothetical protein
MDTTYRCINLVDPSEVGQTAATPELARLVAGYLSRTCRIGLERTDWTDHLGKMKANRSVIVEAENHPGEWTLGH